MNSTASDEGHVRFLGCAASATAEYLDDVVARIRCSELGLGLWHPTGFATFELAHVRGLGLVRVHFWPIGFRRGLRGHPPIHQHCFRLFSRILAGEYRESQYQLVDNIGHAKEMALRKYSVCATGVMGRDEVRDTGEDVYVTPTIRAIRFPAGSWHEVPLGIFHATPIPRTRFCATLAVLSRPVPGALDELLGRPGFGPAVHTRRTVNDDEWQQMRSQFLNAWGTP